MHVQSVQKYYFSLSNMQISGFFVAVLEERSGYFMHENVSCQALFAVILVGDVIRGKKSILEYNKSNKSLAVTLTMVVN